MEFRLESTFLGVRMAQWWDDLALLEAACRTERFGAIIELGTGDGGLSLALALHAEQHGAVFATFDRALPSVKQGTPLLDQYVRPHHVAHDVFGEDGQRMVGGLIARAGDRPALLVCDNGDKPKEVATYTPMLRPGDWLAVHDFGAEITEADIPDCLQPRLTDLMAAHHAFGGTVGGHLRFFVRAADVPPLADPDAVPRDTGPRR